MSTPQIPRYVFVGFILLFSILIPAYFTENLETTKDDLKKTQYAQGEIVAPSKQSKLGRIRVTPEADGQIVWKRIILKFEKSSENNKLLFNEISFKSRKISDTTPDSLTFSGASSKSNEIVTPVYSLENTFFIHAQRELAYESKFLEAIYKKTQQTSNPFLLPLLATAQSFQVHTLGTTVPRLTYLRQKKGIDTIARCYKEKDTFNKLISLKRILEEEVTLIGLKKIFQMNSCLFEEGEAPNRIIELQIRRTSVSNAFEYDPVMIALVEEYSEIHARKRLDTRQEFIQRLFKVADKFLNPNFIDKRFKAISLNVNAIGPRPEEAIRVYTRIMARLDSDGEFSKLSATSLDDRIGLKSLNEQLQKGKNLEKIMALPTDHPARFSLQTNDLLYAQFTSLDQKVKKNFAKIVYGFSDSIKEIEYYESQIERTVGKNKVPLDASNRFMVVMAAVETRNVIRKFGFRYAASGLFETPVFLFFAGLADTQFLAIAASSGYTLPTRLAFQAYIVYQTLPQATGSIAKWKVISEDEKVQAALGLIVGLHAASGFYKSMTKEALGIQDLATTEKSIKETDRLLSAIEENYRALTSTSMKSASLVESTNFPANPRKIYTFEERSKEFSANDEGVPLKQTESAKPKKIQTSQENRLASELEKHKTDVIVVHVGPGGYYPGVLGVKINKNELHIAFEIDRLKHEGFLRDQKLEERFPGKEPDRLGQVIAINEGFGVSGLPKESADIVYINNVFTQPSGGGPNKAPSLLMEAKRVLKPNGRIIIVHTNTPDAYPIHLLKTEAERVGLKVRVLIEPKQGGSLERRLTDEEQQIISRHFGHEPRENKYDSGMYVVELIK